MATITPAILFRQDCEQPDHGVSQDLVLETIIMRMPQENYEKVFDTFIRWARFGDLFSYDEASEIIALQ